MTNNMFMDYMSSVPTLEFQKEFMDFLQVAGPSLYGISLKPSDILKLKRDLERQGYKF